MILYIYYSNVIVVYSGYYIVMCILCQLTLPFSTFQTLNRASTYQILVVYHIDFFHQKLVAVDILCLIPSNNLKGIPFLLAKYLSF